MVCEFFDDLADARKTASADEALRPDAHFARTVAAEYRSVLDEGHAASHASGRDGGAHPGIPAADDHEIVRPLRFRSLGKTELLAAPAAQVAESFRRGLAASSEIDGIAPSFETGEIVQGERYLALSDFDDATVVPGPLGAARSEGRFQWRSIDDYLESSRTSVGLPPGYPVDRSHVDAVSSRGGKRDFGRRVANGATESVGEEIGRSHRIDELRVERPSAVRIETLGFDEQVVRRGESTGDRAKCEQREARRHRAVWVPSVLVHCGGGQIVPWHDSTILVRPEGKFWFRVIPVEHHESWKRCTVILC